MQAQPVQIIQHHIAKTPIQLMQQQTQAISGIVQQNQLLNSPLGSNISGASGGNPKRHQVANNASIMNASTASPHSASSNAAAMLAAQQNQQQLEAMSRTQNRTM